MVIVGGDDKLGHELNVVSCNIKQIDGNCNNNLTS